MSKINQKDSSEQRVVASHVVRTRTMCRWIFYYGEEVCISKLIYGASHGLATMADRAGWTPGCARDAERNHEVNVHGCGALKERRATSDDCAGCAREWIGTDEGWCDASMARGSRVARRRRGTDAVGGRLRVGGSSERASATRD